MRRTAFYTVTIILLALPLCQSYDLTIMHTNDVHARFEQFNKYGSDCSEEDEANDACFGGVARRVTKINEIRDEYENTLLLDAGDQFQGTQWFYYYQGRASSYFMNHMGYDAMALGNHEFDNGVEGLLDFLNNVTFPVLSCNIDASREPELDGLFQKSVVIELGGERIGIVGYIYSRTPEISKPGKNLVFLEEIPSVQAEVDMLIADGVNKIIALGHAGYGTDIDIARNTVGIDIIVGGHSNSFLYTGTPPTDDTVVGPYPTVVTPDSAPEDRVLIVQDYTFAKYLGFLQVTFDDNGKITEYGGNPITLNSTIEEDPPTLAEINEFAVPVKEYTEDVIGETYVFLNGETPICRTMECNLGNVITDAMLEDLVTYQNEESWSDVAISIMNGGGIRASIAQGDITIGEVTTVLPFQGTFDIFDLEGRYILQALENSVYDYNDTSLWGRFLQMSGILVTYNINYPPGERVISVEVRCTECSVPDYEPLEMYKTYRIIAPSFIVGGGDGYTMIADNLQNLVTGSLDSSVLSNYIVKHSPILQGNQKRITFDLLDPSSAMKPSSVLYTIIVPLAMSLRSILGFLISSTRLHDCLSACACNHCQSKAKIFSVVALCMKL